MAINHIIVEGCDRLGKDTLIRGIQDRFGFYQVIHYQQPLLLDKYVKEAMVTYNPIDVKKGALKLYQHHNFITMFKMMTTNTHIICNRGHLGETVYAKRYREYDGNYVFDIEQMFLRMHNVLDHILLVVLHTSDFSFISDDGKSMDVSKRQEEQTDFITAFDRSIIKNKLRIDVCNGQGGFKPAETILDLVSKQL